MISYYNTYTFVSPDPLYAKIKEELKSYFNSGQVDDLLFPSWTKDCLNKLKKAQYSIKETILHIEGYEATLPIDFQSVREAWACAPGKSISYTNPSATYAECVHSAILVGTNEDPYCTTCSDYPETVRVTYKFTDTEEIRYYGRSYLLTPSNSHTRSKCAPQCSTLQSPDTFNISGNKFSVLFSQGIVHLVYYAYEMEGGLPLIPDNEPIQAYIEAYIKYKLMEALYNQVTDETYNQVERKYHIYSQLKDEAFIVARAETISETNQKKQIAIKRQQNALNKYNLPYGRKWN